MPETLITSLKREQDLIIPNVTEKEIFKLRDYATAMGLFTITRPAEKL